MRRQTVALVACILLSVQAILPAGAHKPRKHLSQAARQEYIRRAQVWRPRDISATDVKVGPTGKGAFDSSQPIRCTYRKRPMSGHTPKFTCVVGLDDEVKVKYGRENGEVFAEVAATRLFWVLGFGADRMYSVRVICRGCPFDSQGEPRHPSEGDVVFDPAAVERKMPGHTMESNTDSGWTWPELELVDERVGGAPRAHRDALKLLAAIVQHTDSKAEQQRLVCLTEHDDEDGEDGVCAKPFMLISDLGMTFGHANWLNRDAPGSVNLEKWASTPVWKDPAHCIAHLSRSGTGTLENPRISEEGRAFLADLLTQLSDQQIRDVFEVARMPLRSSDPRRSGTIDEWADAFRRKRAEVVQHSCPP